MKKKKNKKNNTQKSFYFEDHFDNNNFYPKKKLSIKTSLNRVAFLFVVFLSLIFVFSFKIFYIAFSDNNEASFNSANTAQIKTRRDIVDENNIILARNIDIYSAAIRSKLVQDKKKFLINLKIIFPDLELKKISRKIDTKNYFYIKKRITEDERRDLWLLGNKAIVFERKQLRVYPQKNQFSHLLGQIDDDNNGISGVEKNFDSDLKNFEKIDIPLKLTLNTNIQFIIRNELLKFQEIFSNIGSASILMNVNNGDILSLVSLPDFNLNKREEIKDVKYINRVTKGVYELGSVFKTFTIASGLNEKVIEPKTKFTDLPKSITCAGRPIREYDNKIPSNLTAEQILIRSGNIGSVRIAQKVGQEKFKNFLKKIGLLDKIVFDIEEVGQPIPFRWGKCKLATSSYGHGITTTPLQLAKAYSIITNGGYDVTPTLVKKNYQKQIKKRILNEGVSEKVNLILRKIVSTKEGTANFANISGYEVGGKTGTAQKSINGIYSKKKINTFVSIFPTSKPEYILIVLLDEPKTSKDYVYHYKDGSGWKQIGTPYNTAGWTSVEIAGKIIEKIGPILAIKDLQAFNKF